MQAGLKRDKPEGPEDCVYLLERMRLPSGCPALRRGQSGVAWGELQGTPRLPLLLGPCLVAREQTAFLFSSASSAQRCKISTELGNGDMN